MKKILFEIKIKINVVCTFRSGLFGVRYLCNEQLYGLREERRITTAARTPDFRNRKKRVANWEEGSDFFG